MINSRRRHLVLTALSGGVLFAGLAMVPADGIGTTVSPAARTVYLATSSADPSRPAPASPTVSGPSAEVVTLTNAERQRAGCPPVTVDNRLTQAAQSHAEDMGTHHYFSHTGRDGRRFVDRARDAGHPRPGGENIAWGHPTAQRVVAAWMASDDHRANILNCTFRSIGVGFDGRENYWVQVFGR